MRCARRRASRSQRRCVRFFENWRAESEFTGYADEDIPSVPTIEQLAEFVEPIMTEKYGAISHLTSVWFVNEYEQSHRAWAARYYATRYDELDISDDALEWMDDWQKIKEDSLLNAFVSELCETYQQFEG